MSSIGATIELGNEEITRIFKSAKTADSILLSSYKDELFFAFLRGSRVICKIEAETVLNCYNGLIEDFERFQASH